MKLQHQVNLAFGLLLVFVLGFAAILIHFVLMDYLVTTQKQEMRSVSTALAAKLEASGTGVNAQNPEPSNSKENQDTPLPRTETEGAATKIDELPADSSQIFDAYSGMEVYLVDESGKILRESSWASGLPEGVVGSNAPIAEAASNQSRFANAFGSSDRYLTDVIKVPQGNLALVTPFSQIKEVEQALMGRLLLVLIAGGLVAFLLSLLLTRKLISPLVRLRGELKKVRERRFGEVALVKAGGEIGAVARTVHELAGELDRHNRAQKQFFQNASHELKTPLMSIAGYAEGIRDGVFQGESSQKGLGIILSEAGRLTRIVTEMTLLAKLESEEDIFQVSNVDVRELVDDTAERVNPLLAKRNLRMEIKWPEAEPKRHLVAADRDKLLQAFLNLMSNASRHANSVITVEAAFSKETLTVRVQDDGAGFPEGMLSNLFQRFVKGKGGDTGLGLAISRAIVERSGGAVAASNGSGSGAVVTVTLPLANPAHYRNKPSHASASGIRQESA